MKIQIQSLSGHQTSKVIAIMFALFTIPFGLIGVFGFFLAEPMTNENGEEVFFPWLFFAFAPVIYGLMGYIFNRVACWAYNLVSKYVGGIEFNAEDQSS